MNTMTTPLMHLCIFFGEYYLKCKTDESGLKESSGCTLLFFKSKQPKYTCTFFK